MDKAEIKARAVEAKAYVEASSTVLESLAMRGEVTTDAIKETQRLLGHAKTALNELGDLIDTNGEA